jgi:hypothetical protein
MNWIATSGPNREDCQSKLFRIDRTRSLIIVKRRTRLDRRTHFKSTRNRITFSPLSLSLTRSSPSPPLIRRIELSRFDRAQSTIDTFRSFFNFPASISFLVRLTMVRERKTKTIWSRQSHNSLQSVSPFDPLVPPLHLPFGYSQSRKYK